MRMVDISLAFSCVALTIVIAIDGASWWSLGVLVSVASALTATSYTPEFLHDCYANSRAIRYSDIRGEVVFRKGDSVVEASPPPDRIRPCGVRLRRIDGRKRSLLVYRSGYASLRALGWLGPEPSTVRRDA